MKRTEYKLIVTVKSGCTESVLLGMEAPHNTIIEVRDKEGKLVHRSVGWTGK